MLYHEPCYVSYHPGVALAHGIAVPVTTRAEDGFALNAEDIARAWRPGCKALMMNLPCNPTGGTCDRARLEKIARFAVEKDLIVLSDEIYSELVYEGTHTSIAVFPGMRERTIFLHGFSKAFAMTGFRIGYACGPADLIEAMMKVHQYSMLCAPILSQEAALEALRRGEDASSRCAGSTLRRRDLIVRRLNASGLTCNAPGGAFYAFPSVAATGLGDREFAYGLLEAERVAVVPGAPSGRTGADSSGPASQRGTSRSSRPATGSTGTCRAWPPGAVTRHAPNRCDRGPAQCGQEPAFQPPCPKEDLHSP